MQLRNYSKLAIICGTPVRLIAAIVLFAGTWHSEAQVSNAAQSIPTSLAHQVRLPGHMAPEVLNGTAMRIGHYDPSQKLRLAVVLAVPHPVEEQQFLDAIQDKTSPLFHQF